MENKERARQELQKILNEPEYQVYYQDNRNILQIWWDSLKGWLADMLANWFTSLESTSGIAQGILITLISLIIIAVIILIIYMTRNISQKRRFQDTKPLNAVNEKNMTYKDHLRTAKKLESLSQYNMATRHLFLALLLYFHEKQWLEARIWKTNWEYYDELRQVNQASADQFYHLALIFDQVAYGENVVDHEEFIQYRDKVIQSINMDETVQAIEG